MWKIKFFLLVESILGILALVTMLANDVSRVLILSILFLLLIYYYRGGQRSNFLLVAAFFLFFFVSLLNPFVIAGLLFAVIYGFFLLSPLLERERSSETWSSQKNAWWGTAHHFSQGAEAFEDLNLVRAVGRDTIHLDEVALTQHDNVIVLRKALGDTKILVPVDVAVKLQVNSLYGQLRFFEEDYQLRNQCLTLESPDYARATKSVKIIVSNLSGNLEVVRR